VTPNFWTVVYIYIYTHTYRDSTSPNFPLSVCLKPQFEVFKSFESSTRLSVYSKHLATEVCVSLRVSRVSSSISWVERPLHVWWVSMLTRKWCHRRPLVFRGLRLLLFFYPAAALSLKLGLWTSHSSGETVYEDTSSHRRVESRGSLVSFKTRETRTGTR